jgi:hypothetical protein
MAGAAWHPQEVHAVNRRFLLAATVVAAVAACSSGHIDLYEQVKDFRINWSDPQLSDLSWTLVTCEAFGADGAIARHCSTRRQEAQLIVDGLATCQELENISYPACQRVADWRSTHEIQLADFLRRYTATGVAADLSSIRNLCQPSNPMLVAAWSNADRRLAFTGGAWLSLLEVLGVLATFATLLFARSRRRRGHAAPLPITPSTVEPGAEPRFVSRSATPSPVHAPETVVTVEVAVAQRIAEDPVDVSIALDEERERQARATRLAEENEVRRQRRAEQIAKRRAADERARQEFDRFNDLS